MKKTLFIIFLLIGKTLFSQHLSTINGLVAHFPLDNDVNDYSPFHINGNNQNAYPDSSPTREYFHFNGYNAYIYAGYSNRGIAESLSVSVWVRTTSNNLQWIVGHYNHLQDKGFQVVMYNGHAQLRGRDGSNTFYILQDDAQINDGKWHHIVGLFDQNKWTLIVDCYIKNNLTTNASFPMYDITSQPLSISKYPQLNNGVDPLYFEGDIDDIRIYNRVLSICEICQINSSIEGEDEVSDVNKENKQPINNFLIYPNPSENILYVKFLDEIKDNYILLQIINNSGKVILNKKFSKAIEINTSSLKKGTYFVRLFLDNQMLSRKLIIN